MYYILPFESINNIENWIILNHNINNYIYYSYAEATFNPVVMKIPFTENLSKNKQLIDEIAIFQKKLILTNNKNTCNLLDTLKPLETSTKPIIIKFRPIINKHINIEILSS